MLAQNAARRADFSMPHPINVLLPAYIVPSR